jgi:flagellar biosynthesis GTPase FlhF
MDITKLRPILNKESILKTANARELGQAPQDVLERYTNYALTHVPLGDTTRQLKNLERVIIENKHCAVGAIVGPYGYGKTSTAVHLWNELREQKILAIPPSCGSISRS